MKLPELSEKYYLLRTKMRRARRLYVLFCRQAIQKEREIALHRCAVRMLESGMYRGSNVNDVGYRILRMLYAIDLGKPMTNGKIDNCCWGWHHWMTKNKWRASTVWGSFKWVTEHDQAVGE